MKKVNLDLVKQLVYEGLTDEQIGQKVGRSKYTIKVLRLKELGIRKNTLFFMQEWRNVVWQKNTKGMLVTSYIKIPIRFTREMNITDCSKMCYKLTPKLPNELLVTFKKEEDITDKSLIRRRKFRGRKPRSNIIV